MKTNDGGPAFPVEQSYPSDGSGPKPLQTSPFTAMAEGLSVRDYFAAKAMPIATKIFEDGHPNGWEGIAVAAYSIADAMLAARETS